MDDEPATKKFVKDEVDRAIGIMLEKMDDNNRLIMEVLVPMKERTDRIPKIEADIAEIRQDMHTIKVAVKTTNTQVQDHERRITHLETRPA
jgi:predicted  nucleic acid-binding Zn-ribbon protein